MQDPEQVSNGSTSQNVDKDKRANAFDLLYFP